MIKRDAKKKSATEPSTKKLHDVLSGVLRKMQKNYQTKPRALLETWPKIIGTELASMTRAKSFDGGVLFVLVRNSTLLSLLNNPVDKRKILENIRKTLPGIQITDIVYRIG